MADSIYIRLSHIFDDLARLARRVEPFDVQLALGRIVDRLEDIVEDTIGLEMPHREEEP